MIVPKKPLIATTISELITVSLSAATDCGLETESLEEHGDIAVEQGRYVLRAAGDVVERGKYVVVHRRQPDGTWRFGLDIWNSSDPAVSPA